MIFIKKISMLALAGAVVSPLHSNIEIVPTANAKEKCKIGYEWNRQTKKCEVRESSY